MVGMPRRNAWVVAGLVLVAAACGSRPEPRETTTAAAAPVLVAVETVTVALPVELEAQLYVEHDAIVYARSDGIVESVRVDIGERVKAGQVLATLEDVDQRIALAEAEVANASARSVVARARELGGRGVMTVADSEQAEFAYAQAGIALRRAQRAMELTRVVAPFAGLVTARAIRPGRLMAQGDTLFRVTATAPLLVSVRVPEASAAAIALGSTGEVVTRAGRHAPATVTQMSPAVDPGSGTRECILHVTEPEGLRPGAGVTVRLGAEGRRVVAVPASAVSEDGYALVWDGGRTTLRAVSIGTALPDGRVEVLSGLTPGEQVVRATR
ncbi:MAG: efflux RND transporter periplasmic adaptor subunit [Candidatus Palauibacterales bacterium]|nr:efflux RND transporter periplasmic adaptor subunit [Candidatus Palauibacterales bacterium]